MGQIVLFRSLGNGSQAPAIIRRTNEYGGGVVQLDLTVFDHDNIRYFDDVVQGDKPGQWQWPDIPIQ